ncbi:unnamed protein product [Brachionus calyciflorus]|uniref:Angiotensin-converting enzyme n=1 Tax=Brachionus calyciflorus TaxID=104777 RepID=A0A814DYR8_9BILA|nr:unnamed protein product [Brachionus calyciflorus]
MKSKLIILLILSFLSKYNFVKIMRPYPLTDQQIKFLMDSVLKLSKNNDCFRTSRCTREWFNKYNFASSRTSEKSSILAFNFFTNLTDTNQKTMDDFNNFINSFQTQTNLIIKNLKKNLKLFPSDIKRMIELGSIQVTLKDPNEFKRLNELSSQMARIFSSAQICENNNQTCLALDPDIISIMSKSRDYDRLSTIWKLWHDVSGPSYKNIFTEFVGLFNKASRESGYKDASEFWIAEYEDPNFEKNYDTWFNEIKPLYVQLHAYVRRKLKKFYGDKYPKNNKPKLIPAQILGDMHATEWSMIYDIVKPYPQAKIFNLTQQLISKGYTPIKIFKEAEEFYKSIGLFPMTDFFWNNSMFVKPNDRPVECHGGAWDFSNTFDFRISMCTEINELYYYVVYHEMGHIEYFMAYSKQPYLFKSSPFHEAIGDLIYLSVQTPSHLKKIGLIQSEKMTKEQEINYLMKRALEKIGFVGFAYIMDKWRWDVFRGKINALNYNQKWWELREKYQGVKAPVSRSEKDFDPGSKFHVAINYPYSRYFVALVTQFQFYESMCKLANHKGDLHQCDFHRSKVAGGKLREMLSLGNSRDWRFLLRTLTGKTSISTSSLLKYFKPLYDWLVKENSKDFNDKPGF